jgi:hypothetical protein
MLLTVEYRAGVVEAHFDEEGAELLAGIGSLGSRGAQNVFTVIL